MGQVRFPQLPQKKNCCGCSACVQRCPYHCIDMVADEEGFEYPRINKTECARCGLCEKVCFALSPSEESFPLHTLAAINPQEATRQRSSSGGIFSLLAEQIIVSNGVVFGAKFDSSWNVVHAQAKQLDDLSQFRGSKYVQSKIGNSFTEAKELLEKGITVMFVGTPCQIASLNKFLGKMYKHLLTVDFICHGVPSPAVWQWYLKKTAKRIALKSYKGLWFYMRDPKTFIQNIQFRNKENGWKKFQTVIKTKSSCLQQIHSQDPYMQVFLTNLDLRPSCYNCKAKSGRSCSDITIADFWNVHKVVDDFDDDKGTSLVLLNTEKGVNIFKSLNCRSIETDFHESIQYNQAWSISYPENPHRTRFFANYQKHFNDFFK